MQLCVLVVCSCVDLAGTQHLLLASLVYKQQVLRSSLFVTSNDACADYLSTGQVVVVLSAGGSTAWTTPLALVQPALHACSELARAHKAFLTLSPHDTTLCLCVCAAVFVAVIVGSLSMDQHVGTRLQVSSSGCWGPAGGLLITHACRHVLEVAHSTLC